MKNRFIKIFVEGDEKKFIEDYIEYLSSGKFKNYKVITTGGWTNIVKNKNEFLKTTEIHKGGKNLVIFDADENFTERKKELEKRKEDLGVDFDLFLFPNNKDEGDFETLLERIANEKNKAIFDCFQSYENCLSSKEKIYKLPNRKSRIFAYLEALAEETQSKKRDYSIPKCWNLKSDKLNELKSFLLPHIL